MPRSTVPSAAVLPTVAACFFVSGAAALLYEVVWVRLLSVVFGHTVHAVTLVLAAYMGGLALGSLVVARRADGLARPLRAYALLEAAIGAYCAATPLLFAAVDALYPRAAAAFGAGPRTALVQFLLSAALLVPPTALMGATLPILSRAVVRRGQVAAARVGALYSVNTWGAVAGTLATGFLLLPALGLRSTLWLGVALNGAVALAALLLDRLAPDAAGPGGEPLAPAPPAAGPPPGARAAHVALIAIAVSGGASMAYQIAWTRALSLAFGSSTYAFTAMLATFLAGLALGALAAARLVRRRRPGLAAFGWLEIAVAFAALAILPVIGRLPDALLLVLRTTGVSHASALGASFGLGFLVMIGPTLLVGATFPTLLAGLESGHGRLGRDVGTVYGANTLGTIAGSVVAGFFLVPAVGIQRTCTMAAAANLAAGAAVLAVAPGAGPRRRIAAAAAAIAFAAGALAVPHWDPARMTSGAAVYAASLVRRGPAAPAHRVLYYSEGISTTVAVARSPVATTLSVNGKTDASNGFDMATQVLSGHLGPILQPAARRALVIGLASGVTVGALAAHPLDAIDVAELEPSMREASRFFLRENRDALADPRVRVLDGDGRHVLATAPAPYDLVVSEPSNPWIAGVASLFTREFYETVRRHLSDRGVVVQWLGGYAIFARDMKMVARTFQEVFPHVSIWVASPNDFLLVATPGPVALDQRVVEERLASSAAMREDFERFRWNDGALAFRFVLGEEDVRRWAAGAPINTDDRPLLEFSAPLALYSDDARANAAEMRSFRRAERPAVLGLAPERWTGPAGHLAAAWSHWYSGGVEEALDQLARAGPADALGTGARVERARLQFVLGRFDDALRELRALAATRPADPVVARYLKAAIALEQPDVARRLAADSEELPLRVALASLLHELAKALGDRDLDRVAAEQYAAAIQVYPATYDLLNNYAGVLYELGDLDGGIRALRRAVELQPEAANLQFNLGLLLEARGRLDEAAAAYAGAVSIAPDLAPAAERLAAVRARLEPGRRD